MSLFRRRDMSATLEALGVPSRSAAVGSVSVSADTALRHSAVWACLRLRADLVSTTPVDVFRRVAGAQVEVTKPPLLVAPDGGPLVHWLYSTQFDLDRYGNAYGVITQRDGQGFPQRVELVSASTVIVRGEGSTVTDYRIAGKSYAPEEIWHERQYTVAGLPVGLSPIAYAAWSIGGYLSAQQFALDWFATGAAPSGHFRNTEKSSLAEKEARAIKDRFKAAVKDRDVLVTGKDWEYNMAVVPAAEAQFLEQMRYGVTDVCRFLGVPGDMIDGETTSGNITYANVTQRNLQLLVVNLGPVYVRRETAMSGALPAPRYVKFNTDALLRMDPGARTESILARVAGRTLAPSEARELDNLPPFTPEQVSEFDQLFGSKPAPASKQTAPTS